MVNTWEEKRKKLVIYINPPYAEATSAKTVTGTGENKSGVTTQFKINDYLKPKIGNASNEIFALFMGNIYEKMPGCILGQFSNDVKLFKLQLNQPLTVMSFKVRGNLVNFLPLKSKSPLLPFLT